MAILLFQKQFFFTGGTGHAEISHAQMNAGGTGGNAMNNTVKDINVSGNYDKVEVKCVLKISIPLVNGANIDGFSIIVSIIHKVLSFKLVYCALS